MHNEPRKTDKQDATIWVVILLMVALILTGIAVSFAVAMTYQTTEVTAQQTEVQIADTEHITLSMSTATTQSTDGSTSRTLTATVKPRDASNQEVDWSIAWSGSVSGTVTDYVTLTPAGDGSPVATVTCLKAFGSNKIIITVTTRDGGYTATCTVSYKGLASSMEITSTAYSTSNDGRGNYYDIVKNSTGTFTVTLDNYWKSVGEYSLSAQISASGSIYTCDSFSSDGTPNNQNIKLVNVSDLIEKLGITATVNGTTVTVSTGKPLNFSYYSSYEADGVGVGTWYYDKVCWYEDWYSDFYLYPEEYITAGTYNYENLDSCYFVLTVTDSISGISSSVKFWVSESVRSVSLDSTTIEF